MPSEMEFVNFKDFVDGLNETESPTSDDKAVVCNPTNGPRSMLTFVKVAQMKDILKKGNLLYFVDIFENKSVDASGSLSDDAACFTTDFIEVNSGLFFKGKNASDDSAVDLPAWRILYVAYYTTTKTFISRESTALKSPFSCTIPNNCTFIRFSLSKNNASYNNTYIGYKNITGAFVARGGIDIDNLYIDGEDIDALKPNTVNNEDNVLLKNGGNLLEFNASDLLSPKPFVDSVTFGGGVELKGNFAQYLELYADTVLDRSTGGTSTNSSFTTTGFIPCDSTHKPYIGYLYSDGKLIYYVAGAFPLACFYDKYKKYLSYSAQSGDGQFDLTIPEGAKFVRLTGWKNIIGTSTANKFISYERTSGWIEKCWNVFSKQAPEFWEYQKLPYLKFEGNFSELTTAKNSITASCKTNVVGTETDCFVDIKYQGASSLSYPKKNFTIKFYEDSAKTTKMKFVADESWDVYGEQNKYVLKANFVDPSHCRNIVSAKIWGDLVRSRTNPNANLADLPNGGAIDGFPVVVYINNEYKGVYTFNIPKDKWLFNMDGTTKQAIIASEEYTDPCKFKNTDGDFSGDEGCDFTIEYNSDSFPTADVIDSFNDLVSFVINNSGSSFKNGISAYLDVEATIDYIVFMSAVHGSDNWCRNMLFVTFDGVHWIPSAYDMDSTFGSGPMLNTEFYAPSLHPISTNQDWHNLWKRMYESFTDEIYARYNELRSSRNKSFLSDSSVYTKIIRFASKFPLSLMNEEQKMYPSIEKSNVSNASQMIEFYTIRSKINDSITE